MSGQTGAPLVEARADFESAAWVFVDLVDRIPPSAWTAPGLGEWDVRSLVGHTARALSTARDYLGRPAEAIDRRSAADYYVATAAVTDDAAVAARGREAGVSLGSDPAASVRSSAERTLRLLSELPVGADPIIASIAGGIRLSDYLPTRTLELVVHGLDIARATGLEPSGPSAATLGRVAGLLGAVAAAKGRGVDAVLALSGRAPLPAGFSALA